MLLGEDGIIRTAQGAKNTWEGATTNEQKEIQNLVNELNNIINDNGAGNIEISDILERYILGEDKKGVLLTEILDIYTAKFKPNEIIPDASTSLAGIGLDYNKNEYYLTLEYNNEDYMVIGSMSTTGMPDKTKELIKIPEATSGIEKWDKETNDKVTAFSSKDIPSVKVPVPKGFTASTVEAEQTVEGGLVIKQDGTNNEFVWIPVSEERLSQMYIKFTFELSGETGVTTNIYSKTPGGVPGGIGNREPELVTDYDTDAQYYSLINGASSVGEYAQDMVKEYQKIHDSIEKYGGFYIGRYELTGAIGNPTVQKDGIVITNQNWYNLKAACMKIVNNEGKQESEIIAKTTMIYGNQWDEVCNWLSEAGYDIEDSTNWGNYEDNPEEGAGTKQTAGYSESWKANNIYDFAGNCYEWTQEVNEYSRHPYRGGVYEYSNSSAFSRTLGSFPIANDEDLSTRPVLYIM